MMQWSTIGLIASFTMMTACDLGAWPEDIQGASVVDEEAARDQNKKARTQKTHGSLKGGTGKQTKAPGKSGGSGSVAYHKLPLQEEEEDVTGRTESTKENTTEAEKMLQKASEAEELVKKMEQERIRRVDKRAAEELQDDV